MSNDRFHGDRPIQSAEEDQFGFEPLAARIAEALTSQAAGKGFVLGLEGRWGSGKSSLLGLTLKTLREMPGDKVAAVEYRPWLIGDRDQLLTALFEDLTKAVASLENIAGDASEVTKQAAADVIAKARRFATHLSPLGKLAGAAGLFVPGASLVGDVMEKIAAAAADQAKGPTLAAQKEELSKALVKLNCRIVVAIDDVDRLEPKEVAELLRLVRSVADFPNVSYVLCYDARTLAAAIKEATGVESGAAYLEKIVQTEVAVPRPESFALRRWFSSELRGFAECGGHRVPYLQHVIDETGGRVLDTPRAVVRVLDSLRFFWPSLRGRVDLPDLVWLRLIAVGSPNLYRWIEEYIISSVALTAGHVHVSEANRVAMGKRLDKALEDDGLTWKDQQFELERHLPGINFHAFNQGKDERLFSKIGTGSRFQDAGDRRLSSPSHGRMYFSLVQAIDSVTELDLEAIRQAAREGANEVAFMLLEMGEQRGDAGATKAENLLDQLRYADINMVREWPLESLVMGLANCADTLALAEQGDDWGNPRTWYLMKDLLKKLSRGLSDERWTSLIQNTFAASTSRAFLSYLLRDETFGHGFYGERPDPNERLTTKATFEQVRTIMLSRYRDVGIDAILRESAAATMLYAWSQAGGRSDLVEIVSGKSKDDRWFVDFLSKLFGTSTSNNGVHATLSLEGLENFFASPAAVARRVATLASEEPPYPGAMAVVDALKRSIHFEGGDFEEVVRAWEQKEQEEAQRKDG